MRFWIFTLTVLALLLPLAQAQVANNAQTVFVLNSPSWQDAIVTSHYAYAAGYKFKYILGNEDLETLVQEVYGLRVTEAQLYYKRTSALPAIGISLRSLGLSVKDNEYGNHFDLSASILRKLRPNAVIIARDDFALDAISATYLARTIGTTIVFSEGTRGPPQQVIDAIREVGVRKVIVVGNVEEERIRQLADLEVVFLKGRDEFETTRAVNEYAFAIREPGIQSLATTGEIIDNTILYAHNYPVYVVPEISVYSLPQLSALLNKTNQLVVVGVGQSVINAGEAIRAATGVRFIVKITKLRTPSASAFVRRDVTNALNGYAAPLPNYSFEVSSLYPDYADLFGTSTGHAVILDLADQVTNPKAAPPVTIKATLRNNGNIEAPLNLVVRVIDENNQAIAVLRPSDLVVVPARESRTVLLLWPNPPAEGTYSLQANVFADVYEGISRDAPQVSFQLLWMTVWINLLLLILAAIVAIAIGHYSRKIGKTEKEEASLTKSIAEAADKVAHSIEKRFKGK